MKTYRVFKRSATNWEEFSSARKITVRKELTADEARRMCAEFNDSRTAAQKRRGTKLEFTEE